MISNPNITGREAFNHLRGFSPGGRSSNRLILLLCVICSLLFTACKPTNETAKREESPPVSVETIKPSRGPITRFVTLPGEIKPFQQATLFAKVAGYLKSIKVDKGDKVQEGALLAEIEVPELLADRARFNAEVEVAQLDFHRLSESQKKSPDLVMPQSVDDARAKLEIAKANLDRTETLLQYSRIVAPFSGIITRRMVDPGAFIPAATSGGAQNAAIVTIADFNRVRLQVAVPEFEASQLALNQPVKVTVEGLPGRTIEGTVTRFAYALDDESRTMLGEIELANPDLELRPGMYATVKIGIQRKEEALLLPVDALMTEKAGTSVFVLSENRSKKARVQTGFNDGAKVEIVKGLDPNQTVILIGKRGLVDGQPVTVSESK
jgi:membrane fusion protein (multidrug efflux system)